MTYKILRLFLIFTVCISFSFAPSYGLTETVDLFGEINSTELILNDIWIEQENLKNGEAITVKGSIYNAGIIPTDEVSNAITIGYIVNGELVEIALLENLLPGIENGAIISSGPIFDAIQGRYIVTVIVNYHDTISHLRDNPENNIVQKTFQIGDKIPSLITTNTYQRYNQETNQQEITIEGQVTDIFQEKLHNKKIIIEIDDQNKQVITDSEGRFNTEFNIPFVQKIVEIATYSEEDSSLSNHEIIFPIKLDNNESALSLEIISDDPKKQMEDIVIVIFQDSYNKVFKKISMDQTYDKSFKIDNIYTTILPANHQYIIEIYVDGRLLDAFQNDFSSNAIIKRDVSVSESAQIQFRVTDEDGEPQRNVTIENWRYTATSNEEGLTEWIHVLPTFIEKEPYVAKATFPNGEIAWSESFEIKDGERKVVQIIRGTIPNE